MRGLFGQLHHQPDTAAVPKGHQHPHSGAEGHPLGDGVIEKFIKTAGGFFHRYPGNRGQTAYLLFGKWGGLKRPFTNTAKWSLFCSPKVNISLFLMESLQNWGLLGENCINSGFYWGK